MASQLVKVTVKFTRSQRRHLKTLATREGHRKMSVTLKRLVEADMAKEADHDTR